MKFAVRQYMLRPGSLTEQFAHAAELGLDGIEMMPVSDEQWPELVAAIGSSGVKPAVLSNAAGQKAMHAEAAERRAWVEAGFRALDRCAEVGATGFIVVPTLPNKMQNMPRIPDLWPYQSQVEAEQNVFVEMLHRLGEHAAPLGVFVIVECLNRYEQFWPLRLEEGVELCRRADSRGVGILADYFHMQIEEADIAASLRAAMDWIVHVHLADSHRRQPGTGHTDFAPGLAALKQAGYDRFYGFEYGLGPDRDADIRGALSHIKSLL